ncbi:MAG: DoxX family protein [Phycisphaerales bacterium]|nr:DoxX family protein [Phycisphaerales bacterium]
MSFSQATGTTFMPLLSRIVLGSAFLLSGWYHCFSTGDFTPAQQDQIKQMQASVGHGATKARVVVLQDGDGGDAETPPAAEPKPADDPPAAKEPEGTRAMYRIALDLHQWGIKGAVPLAWGIAVFEIVAGALVLLGLFTRLWGFLLACLIGAGFALTSVQEHGMFQDNPFQWRGNPAAYYEMYFQAAGFVLALGLFLVGPGVLALDSVVFGRRQAKANASTPANQAS